MLKTGMSSISKRFLANRSISIVFRVVSKQVQCLKSILILERAIQTIFRDPILRFMTLKKCSKLSRTLHLPSFTPHDNLFFERPWTRANQIQNFNNILTYACFFRSIWTQTKTAIIFELQLYIISNCCYINNSDFIFMIFFFCYLITYIASVLVVICRRMQTMIIWKKYY